MRPDVRPPLAFSRRPAARLPLRRHAALRRRLCSRRRSHRRGARARVRGLRRGRVRRAPPTLAARDAPADHGGAWQEVAAPAQGEEGSWSIIQLASGQLLPSVEERSASRCVPTHAATLIYNITEGRYAFLYRRVTSRDRHTGHRGRASSCCSLNRLRGSSVGKTQRTKACKPRLAGTAVWAPAARPPCKPARQSHRHHGVAERRPRWSWELWE